MKRLYRSAGNRFIAGICGGVGESYDWDPTIVRLILVALAMFTGGVPLLITYLVGWAIIPLNPGPQNSA